MSMSPEELAALQSYLGGGATKHPDFTDSKTGIRYTWDNTQQQYIPAPGVTLPAAAPKTFTTKKGDIYQYDTPPGDTGPILPRQIYNEPDEPTLKEFPDGSLRQWNGNAWDIVGQPTTDPQEQALRRRLLEAQVANAERPPQAPLGRQLTPAELQLQDLNVQKGQLDIEKSRRDLQDNYTRAMNDRFTAIQGLQTRLANGDITPQDADQQMMLVNQSYEAALKGTTPWAMEQAKRTQETNRQSLAGNIMGDRAQTASTMGSSLLTGLMGAYGKLRTSNNAPPMPDPLQMAQGFADENTGGAEMSRLARSVLMGALGGQ